MPATTDITFCASCPWPIKAVPCQDQSGSSAQAQEPAQANSTWQNSTMPNSTWQTQQGVKRQREDESGYVRELRDALLNADGEADSAFSRTTPDDIERRLLTDNELEQLRKETGVPIINRVLFLAVSKTGTIIGSCAATLAAPWCPNGVGSWGLLAVSTPKLGVGRALIEHCEQYIRTAMLDRIRIEYFFIAGLPSSEALRQWYENRLQYLCFKAPSTGRSYRGNEVRGEVTFRHCEKGLDISGGFNAEVAAALPEKAVLEARRKSLAKFLLAGTKQQ